MMVPTHKLAAFCVVFIVLSNQGLAAPVDEHASVPRDKKPQQSSSKLEEELKLQNPSKHLTQESVPPKIDLAAQDVLQEDLNGDSMKQILDSMSFEDILESVLETLKDHPNILKELTEEEEKNTGIAVDDDFLDSIPADFQKPPPQLMEVPKRVEKKAGNSYLKEKKKSDKWKMYKQKNSGSSSSEENFWKQKYDDSSSSESSSSSSSSSSSEENSMEKRDKEQMEDTIDLVSLPMEGGEENKRANKNLFKQYRAWGPQEHFTENQLQLLNNNPYINTLPLFMPEDLNQQDSYNTEIQPENQQQEKPEKDSEAPVKTLDQIKAIEKNVAEKKEKTKLKAHKQEKTSDESDLKALIDEGNAEMSKRNRM